MNVGKMAGMAVAAMLVAAGGAMADSFGTGDNPNKPAKEAGCNIKRNGGPGTYFYSVASDWANRPVNWVSWADAARFANWLTNGQGNGGTEDGSYALYGATTEAALQGVTRNTPGQGARYYIPTTAPIRLRP